MSIRKYLATEPLHAIIKYSSTGNLSKEHVAFTGAPKKHPYDTDKLILITDPFSANTLFYEFKLGDIAQVDELPHLVNEVGTSVQMVRVWVKKGSFGIRYEPFMVADTVAVLKKAMTRHPKRKRKL